MQKHIKIPNSYCNTIWTGGNVAENQHMLCRLPGKLSEMDKAAYFTCSTQFQELSCFSLLHFQSHIDILSYKIPSAIKNQLITLHLILTPMTNQCKIESISRTKNRISNFHKITSSGISIFFFNLKYLMKGVQGFTLHTIYRLTLSQFHFLFMC